jgi:transcription antitermination factor NusG
LSEILVNRSSTPLAGHSIVLSGCRIEPTSRWFAVYIRPRHEKRVQEHLQYRRIECYLPLYTMARRWRNGCKVRIEHPLFPGYLFVRIGKWERVGVLSVPGVISFVGTGSQPAPLSDFEIETLRSGLHLQNFEPYRKLVIGQRVRIKAGALTGLTGVLVRGANGLRVVLTVELIQQSVAVEVDAANLEPISK